MKYAAEENLEATTVAEVTDTNRVQDVLERKVHTGSQQRLPQHQRSPAVRKSFRMLIQRHVAAASAGDAV